MATKSGRKACKLAFVLGRQGPRLGLGGQEGMVVPGKPRRQGVEPVGLGLRVVFAGHHHGDRQRAHAAVVDPGGAEGPHGLHQERAGLAATGVASSLRFASEAQDGHLQGVAGRQQVGTTVIAAARRAAIERR
ncbi:MAG: hypothetical protein D6705_09355 [Deltaproteobacteria bacterium]|nr:MAG: hypothetical protein D6705_09355 [Deltaproteobacteria bacterium]